MSVRSSMSDALMDQELVLRVLTLDDASELHAIFSDPSTHTIGDGAITDFNETRSWLIRRAEKRIRHGVTWYGVRVADGPLIGNSGLFIGRTGADEPEVGFEIRADHQRQGYGRRALQAVVTEAHSSGFARVWATVRPSNHASLHALARIGFHEVRTELDGRGPLLFLVHSTAS